MTDTESKVRRIAEWMGLEGFYSWVGTPAGDLLCYATSTKYFAPHLNGPVPAADRERVMLAMHNKVSHTPYDFGDGNYGWLITERLVNPHLRHIWEADVGSPSLGLAFIDAVCQYLDAQAGE